MALHVVNTLRQHPGFVFVSLFIVVLLIWGFWPKPIAVEGAKVHIAPMTISVEEDGRTRVIDRYVVSAPINGMTCRMHLKVGEDVTQGEMLMAITPLASQVLDARTRAQAKANVAAAKSALQAAQEQAKSIASEVSFAINEEQRFKPLLEKGLIAKEVYDKARTVATTAQANQRSANFKVEVAKHEFQAAKTTVEYSGSKTMTDASDRVTVNSPIDGKILKVARQCDGPVMTGEALLEIGDPSALEVEVDVLSADAVKIKPGMKVLFDRWGGDKPLEGEVRIVEPVGFTKVSALGVEEQRVLVISDFRSPFENWQSLGDGYRVEAKFILWHEERVLQVPTSALFRYQNGWAVFAIDGDTAVRKTVEIGYRNGLTAQVLSGLSEHEQVINHPSDLIDDGVAITIR